MCNGPAVGAGLGVAQAVMQQGQAVDQVNATNARTSVIHSNAIQETVNTHQTNQTNFRRTVESANEEGFEAVLEKRAAVATDAAKAAGAGVSGTSVAAALAAQVAKGGRNAQKINTAREDALLDYLVGQDSATQRGQSIIDANPYIEAPSTASMLLNAAIGAGTGAIAGGLEIESFDSLFNFAPKSGNLAIHTSDASNIWT